jgi:hypothetical protein
MVADGRITVNDFEANAVKEIFSRYISGESYMNIANAMEANGVCYHLGKLEWNKNMVKRILENSKYTGETGYPLIVSADDFERVKMLQSDKTAGYREITEAERLIRSKLINTGNIRIRQLAAPLESRVTALLNEFIKEPEILNIKPLNVPAPSAETVKLQHELNREFGRSEFNVDYAVTLVFALAAEKYDELPDVTLYNQLTELKAELSRQEPLAEFDSELFSKIADKVTIDADGELSLTAIGGTIITEAMTGIMPENAIKNTIENISGEERYGLQLT